MEFPLCYLEKRKEKKRKEIYYAYRRNVKLINVEFYFSFYYASRKYGKVEEISVFEY